MKPYQVIILYVLSFLVIFSYPFIFFSIYYSSAYYEIEGLALSDSMIGLLVFMVGYFSLIISQLKIMSGLRWENDGGFV